MNVLSGTSWFWKALRLNSITFAALFSSGILGLSVTRILQNALGVLGVPWLGLLIVPIVLIGLIARKEKEWMPDEAERKRWARRLVFGSIVASVLLALVFPEPTSTNGASERTERARIRGPSGK